MAEGGADQRECKPHEERQEVGRDLETVIAKRRCHGEMAGHPGQPPQGRNDAEADAAEEDPACHRMEGALRELRVDPVSDPEQDGDAGGIGHEGDGNRGGKHQQGLGETVLLAEAVEVAGEQHCDHRHALDARAGGADMRAEIAKLDAGQCRFDEDRETGRFQHRSDEAQRRIRQRSPIGKDLDGGDAGGGAEHCGERHVWTGGAQDSLR